MQFSSPWRRALPAVAAIILAFAFPLTVLAQDDGVTAAPASGSGVARIDAIAGEVAIQRGDSNETLAAVPNAPVLGADYVTTGPTGRAEVGFDGRSAVRLGENVQIRFSNIDPADRQMQLAAGTIELRLFGDTDGQSIIDTPSISVVPRTSGSFRVFVDGDGVTAVTVRSGRADIITPQGTQSLQPGTTLVAEGPAANPNVRARAAIALDSFDSYNGERDHIYQVASADSQFVNTNIEGIGDLDQNGRWADDGTYGHVWMPTNVAADWAPYRDGNWTWEDGYGWTWVAAEPWGWAPYHYGRWYFSTAYHHWAWYPPAPGRFAPAWSPALVGFVGFNIGSVNVGIGFGNIGWVPLAPFETFHPWWGPRATTIVNNNVRFRNMAVNNAMTSVTRENFQNGRFGQRTIPSQEQLRSIHTVGLQGALPIVPSQANLRFTQRSAAPALAMHSFPINRAFAGRQAPLQRTPFTEQQASVSRATQNDSWSRFSTNRNADRTSANGNNAPSFARPLAQPADNHQGTPAFSRSGAPAFVRPAAPAYTRPAAPAYTRPAAPAYSRSAPAARPAAPAARPAAPAARETRSDNRRGSDARRGR